MELEQYKVSGEFVASADPGVRKYHFAGRVTAGLAKGLCALADDLATGSKHGKFATEA